MLKPLSTDSASEQDPQELKPMSDLLDEFFRGPDNPNPPQFHFGFRVDIETIFSVAASLGENDYDPQARNEISFMTLPWLAQRLSDDFRADFEFGVIVLDGDLDEVPDWVLEGPRCFLVWDDNYKDLELKDFELKEVVQLIRERFNLDPTVQPLWYPGLYILSKAAL